MHFTADFHIHSKYSNATSKFMDIALLSTWAQFKGINVMGTGDFTHPLWNLQLKSHLDQAEQGLFCLKSEYKTAADAAVYNSCKGLHRFILSAEISTVFKRNGRCYRSHTIILAPSFVVADKIRQELAIVGNVISDGRPILGMDIKDLVKIVLNASPDCMVIPAHIWAPWYGILGSKSGFDSVYDCFEELTDHIFALEVGLSASMLMNARRSELDRFALLSNSDAHCVQKLGREANIFNADLSYHAITGVLRANDRSKLIAGIELFPELGKYYADGHKKCAIVAGSQGIVRDEFLCSVCGKLLIIGVASRVEQLADRSEQKALLLAQKSYKIVPLFYIIERAMCLSRTSKKVDAMYHGMLQKLGNEFFILLHASIDDIAASSTSEIARIILKIRQKDLIISSGYDGQHGMIEF